MTVTRQRLEIQANQKWEDIRTRTIMNQMRRGYLNNGAEVTLANGQTSTTVADDIVNSNSVIHLTPETSTAAAVTYWVPRATITQGQYVVQHNSLSTSDCTFMTTVTG